MSFRKVFTLVVGFVVAVSIPAEKPFAADNDYVFILAAHDNPYWNVLGNGIKDEAKTKGITPVIYEAANGSDAEGELNICLTAVQSKPKIIVMGSLNSSVGIQCFKKAVENGIIVADVDATVSMGEAEKAGIKLAFSIGSDNELVGEEAANYVYRAAGKPDPKIFILEGVPGSVPAQKRLSGFRKKIQELMPKADIVASISANWDRLKAMSITLDLLQRQPNLDIIYAANDTMALGAVEAARNSGRDKQIKIIGIDGTADARKAIMEGRLTASVAQLPYLMGMRSVDLAIDAVTNHKTGFSITTETPVLTKDMIEANKDPVLQYVR
jgi:ABC-type sugar transport system substrate-binding protein